MVFQKTSEPKEAVVAIPRRLAKMIRLSQMALELSEHCGGGTVLSAQLFAERDGAAEQRCVPAGVDVDFREETLIHGRGQGFALDSARANAMGLSLFRFVLGALFRVVDMLEPFNRFVRVADPVVAQELLRFKVV